MVKIIELEKEIGSFQLNIKRLFFSGEKSTWPDRQ